MSKEHIEHEATCKDCFHYDVCANPCTKYYYRVPCRKFVNSADVEPVVHGEWIGMEGDVCSECYRSLTEIMDADSYFAIGFDPSDLVACPFCGALMDGGNKNG